MTKAKMGRPTKHNAKLAEKICLRLALGESLRTICQDDKMPGMRTVMTWVSSDHKDFQQQYAQARETQAELLADELMEIADDSTNDYMERRGQTMVDQENIQRSRLRVDTRKWYLSKVLPKFKDKTEQEHTGNVNVTIKQY